MLGSRCPDRHLLRFTGSRQQRRKSLPRERVRSLAQIRRRLAGHSDGDRQFVDILTAAAEAGLDAVEAACAEALSAKLCGRDVVLNIPARQRNAPPPFPVATPATLTLAIEPAADCARYDQLRRPPAAQEAYRGAA